MLSLAPANAAGAIPRGAATSMASANGTRTRSESAPPQSPPNAPKPYMERGATLVQSPVCPRRQRAQAPQEIWKGTTTRSPGATVRTSSPTSVTSATNS